MMKKKYKVGWIESHNPRNWGDTYKKGMGNILTQLPPDTKEINLGNHDEWVDLECWDNFETDTNEKAYQYVLDNYDIPNDVFSILDETGRSIATEEGIING